MKVAMALALILGLLLAAVTYGDYTAQVVILGIAGAFIVCVLVVYLLPEKPGSGPGT